MAEENIYSFLSPTISNIRKSILNIDDSYNNYWDILAELLQNSVDAIIKRSSDEGRAISGRIDIKIDCQKKEIEITDDGCGIPPSDLRPLLKPFSTNKSDDPRLIGEKGVGLTFAYFQSTFFEITTGDATGTASARITDARLWKQSSDEIKEPKLDFSSSEEPCRGTKIYLKGIDNDALFSLTIPQMEYVLRTRTAVGSTAFLWNDSRNAPPKINVCFDMTDINGRSSGNKIIPFRYMLPTEAVGEDGCLDLDVYKAWYQKQNRTDDAKRNMLKHKIVFCKGNAKIGRNSDRSIDYWACFVPSSRAWNTLSEFIDPAIKKKLEDEKDERWAEDHEELLFHEGIYAVVKDMPTGIRISQPKTGASGYWSNIFILFQDNQLKFDIGRKSIYGRAVSMYQDFARSIFNRFHREIGAYITGNVDTINGQDDWDRVTYITTVRGLLDIGSNSLPFLKSPMNQEASVAAIFYELIGMGKIKDVIPMISGYRDRYDLTAQWVCGERKREVIIEFKSHLKNIRKDYSDYRKMFDEMDYIVCWEVTDDDLASLEDVGITVTPIEKNNPLNIGHECITCSTHRMTMMNVSPVYVIDIKRLVDSLDAPGQDGDA